MIEQHIESRISPKASGPFLRSILLRILAAPAWGWFTLLATIVLVWFAVVTIGKVPAIIAPSPSTVFADLWLSRDTYIVAALQTTMSAYVGLAIGTAMAVVLSITSWWSAGLNGLFRPIVYFLQAVPMTAMIPVVSGVVGYGYSAVITLTTMSALFPTYIIFGTALSRPPRSAELVLSALGATRSQFLFRVAIPAALPSLFSGMQLGVTLGVLGAFATEFLQGGWGLGGLFAVTRRIFANPATPWGIAVIATLLSSLSYGLFHILSRNMYKRFN